MEIDRVCIPGDTLVLASEVEGASLGPGLRVDVEGYVSCYRAGLLKGRGGKAYWIDCRSKRYVPAQEERVIGVITHTQRSYRVDIAAHSSASLPELSFEGATKKNKPNLQVGDVVYCRLTMATPDVEPEVTCVSRDGKSHGLGPLKETNTSYLLTCSLGLCRRLVQPKCFVLEALRERGFQCDVVVGTNGRVWVDSAHLHQTIAVVNALTLSETMTDGEIHKAVQEIADSIAA